MKDGTSQTPFFRVISENLNGCVNGAPIYFWATLAQAVKGKARQYVSRAETGTRGKTTGLLHICMVSYQENF